MPGFTFPVKGATQFLGAIRDVLFRVAFCVLFATPVMAGGWLRLSKDGIHDPKSPAVNMLQQPKEALSRLTPDGPGNQVRWVQALEKGEIQPREKIFSGTEVRKLDQDILLNLKGGMPVVRFPHKQHTEWLDCVNCHDKIFARKTGDTKISMFKILQGEQCGICHGAVAFPLTECGRCHSVVRPTTQKPDISPVIDPKTYHQPQGATQ